MFDEFRFVQSYRLKRAIRELGREIEDMRKDNIVGMMFEDQVVDVGVAVMRARREKLKCELARRWFGEPGS